MDEYLEDRQLEALQISSLVNGLQILVRDQSREARGAAMEIADMLAPIAHEHNLNLDSVNRPEAVS